MKTNKSGSHVARLRAVTAALLLAVPLWAHAALDASLDRDNIRMGETAQLTLTSNGPADPSDADLSALRASFRILQRSTSTRAEISNGQRLRRRDLILEVTPLREGAIVIPPFVVDSERSQALRVSVQPEMKLGSSEEIVLFEAETDRSDMYVQGQLLLTLRIQQAVNLDSRSVTELQLDGAFVKSLGQNSFQRTIDGRPWLVHEIRYAIFPETSGELRIPIQSFSGRLSSGRRSLFDTRSGGQLLQRDSKEIVIDVRPRPASFTDPTWLPASGLSVEEQWSAPVEEMRVGDSITRTITLTGEGLQGAQLPPIYMVASEGLRVYPDQPSINDVDGASGVTGIRMDSLALVAVRAGEYEIPSITIDWWDTQSDRQRQATLPGRRIKVVAVPIAFDRAAADAQLDVTALTAENSSQISASAVWPWLTTLCAGGWLLTTIALWRRPRPDVGRVALPNASETRKKDVLSACRANDPLRTRQRLREWLSSQGYSGTLEAWADHKGDDALCEAIAELEQSLFGESSLSGSWQGEHLARAVKNLSHGKSKASGNSDDLPPLYAS